MAKIFISYSRQSEAMAKSLVDDFESLGHDVWFDQELSGGQAWWDQILAMIRDSNLLVFLLDPKVLNSTACQREFSYADDLGKPILPVLVADGVSTNLLPPELSRIQFVDYRKQDRNTAFSLARALASIPPSKPLPDPLPPPPEVPHSYLGHLGRKVTAPTLSFEEQSALVVDLKTSLRDPEFGDDTRTLLKRLRNRRDLFATVAAEIDDVLGRQRQTSPVLPVASTPERPPKPARTFRAGRLLSACVGAACGALWGWIAAGTPVLFGPDDRQVAIVIDGVAGAITGAISGTNRKVLVIAFAGLVLGFGAYAMGGLREPDFSSFETAAVIGGAIGAILGAIVGAIVRKAKGWT